MSKNVRRVLSSVALTSLAATMVACQTVPTAPGAFGPRPGINVGGFNAAPGSRVQPRSENEAKLADAVARGLEAVPGEYLVKMQPGANPNQVMGAASANPALQAMGGLNAELVGQTQSGPIFVMKANNMMGAMNVQPQQAVQALSQMPGVMGVEPNYIVKLELPQSGGEPTPPVAQKPGTPNDPLFSRQYHFDNVKVVEGWAQSARNEFVVAVVDTGVDSKHPDLAANILPGGWNTVDDVPAESDGNGHGTHVAGTIAAVTNNGIGVAGVAPNVKLLSIQVLSAQGYGSYESVAKGIIMAADKGAKVISMSLGGPRSSSVIQDAVDHAISKGALLVAAMGNSAHGDSNNPTARPSYPAASKGVMAVGATDKNDRIARFSQAGQWNSVVAPGVDIMATFPTTPSDMPGKDYGAISGTSMATPIVSAVASMVWSKNPGLTAQQVKAHIEATSDDLGPSGYDILFGHGRVNALKALSTPPGAAAVPGQVNAAAFRR
ncbi:MAG: S8 family serine peptidase [Candidatus Sericytochromatia bacterium]|nr:S8 family serine peptidase [Candidatus Sericytochromatia bacterium]